MRFALTDEQLAFGRSLGGMLAAADVPGAARAWATGDHGPGRALFGRLAEAGVFALAAPERDGGLGVLPVELTVAFVELGRHAVPGPLAETVAAGVLLTGLAEAGDPVPGLVPGLLAGRPATVVLPGGGAYALDADAADPVLVVEPGPAGSASLRAAPGHGPLRGGTDPVRRSAIPSGGGRTLAEGGAVARSAARAGEFARLLTAAQSLGLGLALLERTVAYARSRHQFGAPIGSFQAVKHRLADILIALEFARPLLFGAALTLDFRDIAAAKTATGEAAYAAALTALQLHGAIGYTDELPLSLHLRKARPLRDAWGSPSHCRALLLTDHPPPLPPRSP
ncbi:acyl-CoA dehydrogenase family protein [Streptomyces sp. NPDC014894]|uniref:acyl-CoA dehydrogenase family protein n=1 Tax=Streptomyces sp. NPDC014894 TaxID=3364931 RepID=UPI0036FCE684